MRVGFIGLGNVGSKLAASLLRNEFDLTVLDLRPEAVERMISSGARLGDSPAAMAKECDVVITSLPSPEASAQVVEGPGGVLEGITPGTVWMEMSTTSRQEVVRLADPIEDRGGHVLDCPVSGGCHRAQTGNIAIFAGGDREPFERVLPLLSAMGRQILHTGPLGSASVLKVISNYLASANLVALAEALAVAVASGMDLNTTYEAIRVSSGNSFVHETEGQLILNGSRNIDFTMDLAVKDMRLFQEMAEREAPPLELAPLLTSIFEDGMSRYGPREWSTNIIRRFEDASGRQVLAPGFPEVLVDDEPEEPGREIIVDRPVRLNR